MVMKLRSWWHVTADDDTEKDDDDDNFDGDAVAQMVTQTPADGERENRRRAQMSRKSKKVANLHLMQNRGWNDSNREGEREAEKRFW